MVKTTSNMTTEQLRRKAYKAGFRLSSGFRYDKHDGEYVRDEDGHCVRGYQLEDLNNGGTLVYLDSEYEHNCQYASDLDEIEEYLKYEYKCRGMKW